MNKSDSIKELATALCKFQGAVETVRKEAVNPFFKSKYASLANILDVIRKPLFENGLSFVQLPAGEHNLTTMLMHVSGEWIEETYSMTPTKNDPQGLGSVITYQRRYALGAVLGLNIDDDDDGNSGSKLPEQKTNHSDANYSGLKPAALPNISEEMLSRAIAKARNGEEGIWDKLNASFSLTTAQVTRYQREMNSKQTV